MSYDIQVHRREVQAQHNKVGSTIFEEPSRLKPFTKAQTAKILERLELVGFSKPKKNKGGLQLHNRKWKAEALLTASGLYLNASGGDAIFEVSMFASELADKSLAKFDPRDGSWE
jgi:hypothetical protein